MAKRNQKTQQTEEPTRIEMLASKARKMRSKGDDRKALTTLREACMLDDHCAWLWTLYGVWLGRMGRSEEALRALRHALWLRKSTNDAPRMKSTQRLIDALGLDSLAA